MTTDTSGRQQEFFNNDKDAGWIDIGQVVRSQWGGKLVYKGPGPGDGEGLFLDKEGDVHTYSEDFMRTEAEFQSDLRLAEKALEGPEGSEKRLAKVKEIIDRINKPLEVREGEFVRARSLYSFEAGDVYVAPEGWRVVVLGRCHDEQKVVCLDSGGDMEFYGIHELRTEEEYEEHKKLAAAALK